MFTSISPPRFVLCSWYCSHIQSWQSELHRTQRAKKVCDQDLVRITWEQILPYTNCGYANSLGTNSKLKWNYPTTQSTLIIVTAKCSYHNVNYNISKITVNMHVGVCVSDYWTNKGYEPDGSHHFHTAWLECYRVQGGGF